MSLIVIHVRNVRNVRNVLVCLLIKNFTSCSIVSIVNFEQVNVGLEKIFKAHSFALALCFHSYISKNLYHASDRSYIFSSFLQVLPFV